MNRTNVVHGEEDRKINLGDSLDFLIEKEVEGTDVTETAVLEH